MLNGNISKCDSQKVRTTRLFFFIRSHFNPRPHFPPSAMIGCHLLKLSRCKSTSYASALAGQPSEHVTPKAQSSHFPLSRTSSRPAAEKHVRDFTRKVGPVFLVDIYTRNKNQQGFFGVLQAKTVGVFPVFPAKVGVSSALKHQLPYGDVAFTNHLWPSWGWLIVGFTTLSIIIINIIYIGARTAIISPKNPS